MLFVYELKSERSPEGAPQEGLSGIWAEPPYYYLFYRQDSLSAVLAWIKSRPGRRLGSTYTIPYEQWQDVSGTEFEAGAFRVLPIGAPPAAEGPSSGIPLRIDPGIFFGSGLHPTTRGCLEAISALFDAGSPSRGRIRTVVDFGTGTGILAVGAALLGAHRVFGIDNNPAAPGAARRNAELNRVGGSTHFLAGDRLSVLRSPSDLLVMNLEWPFLEKVLEAREWKGYQFLIAAGFLPSRLVSLSDLTSPFFEPVHTTALDGWPVVALARRSP